MSSTKKGQVLLCNNKAISKHIKAATGQWSTFVAVCYLPLQTAAIYTLALNFKKQKFNIYNFKISYHVPPAYIHAPHIHVHVHVCTPVSIFIVYMHMHAHLYTFFSTCCAYFVKKDKVTFT